jgi:hypothetical protein
MDKGKIRGSMYEWKVVSYTPHEKSKCIMNDPCNEIKLPQLKRKRR